jgi:hypothetical protein
MFATKDTGGFAFQRGPFDRIYFDAAAIAVCTGTESQHTVFHALCEAKVTLW